MSGISFILKQIRKNFKEMDKGKLVSIQEAGAPATRSAEVSAPTNLGRRKPKNKGRRKEDKKRSSKQIGSDMVGAVMDRAMERAAGKVYDLRKTTRRRGQGQRKDMQTGGYNRTIK